MKKIFHKKIFAFFLSALLVLALSLDLNVTLVLVAVKIQSHFLLASRIRRCL